jgi:hypothetical protein
MSLEQEEFLKEHGYFVVHDVMPKDVCENLAKEFARDAEYIGVKDDLCPSVNGLYNHMPFVRTLVGLVPHISHLVKLFCQHMLMPVTTTIRGPI